LNVLVVSASRSGSSYVSERLKDSNNIDYNLYEAFTIALERSNSKPRYYTEFCNNWKSTKCIAKIKIPYDWVNALGNTWLKNNLKQADVYYLSRNRVEHILDLIAESQETSLPEDWEVEPTNIVISDPAQIIECHTQLNFVDSVIAEMKEINNGYDITLEEIKNIAELRDYGKPKRIYNYVNELPQYQHLDVRKAVSLIINNA
tara:strand:- start:62 stop:670 length:609 start_codon:yes stop_codon:yes gene_type:complete